MKFSCEKLSLVSAISLASRVVAVKSAISALEGIFIKAGTTGVSVTGYNLETGITATLPAEVQESGECVMPARLFFDIIRKLPDDTVSITVDEKFKVSIRGGISSFTIAASSGDDYPELPDVEAEKSILIPQTELAKRAGVTRQTIGLTQDKIRRSRFRAQGSGKNPRRRRNERLDLRRQ